MEEQKQVVPKDIQDAAIHYADEHDHIDSEYHAYIAGAMDERAKGNWTDEDMIDAMEFIGTCTINSNHDLLKWSKYFLNNKREQKS